MAISTSLNITTSLPGDTTQHNTTRPYTHTCSDLEAKRIILTGLFFMAGGGAGLRLAPLDLSNLYLFPLQTLIKQNTSKNTSHMQHLPRKGKKAGESNFLTRMKIYSEFFFKPKRIQHSQICAAPFAARTTWQPMSHNVLCFHSLYVGMLFFRKVFSIAQGN